jgi:hypothetical protein
MWTLCHLARAVYYNCSQWLESLGKQPGWCCWENPRPDTGDPLNDLPVREGERPREPKLRQKMGLAETLALPGQAFETASLEQMPAKSGTRWSASLPGFPHSLLASSGVTLGRPK